MSAVSIHSTSMLPPVAVAPSAPADPLKAIGIEPKRYEHELGVDELTRLEKILQPSTPYKLTPITGNAGLSNPEFTLAELTDFINAELNPQNLLKESPWLVGGAASHVMSGLSYGDVDLSFYVNENLDLQNQFGLDEFGFIYRAVRKFVCQKIGVGVTDDVIDQYIKTNQFGGLLLIRIGGVDLKFVLNHDKRLSVAFSDGFHIQLAPKHKTCCIDGKVWCDKRGFEEALTNLKCRRLVLKNAEELLDYAEPVLDLFWRIAHKMTLGFSIETADGATLPQLSNLALKQLLETYPCNTPKSIEKFLEKIFTHQNNHYPQDDVGRILDFLNLLSFIHAGANQPGDTLCEERKILTKHLAKFWENHPIVDTLRDGSCLLHGLIQLIKENPDNTQDLLALAKGLFFQCSLKTNALSIPYQFPFANGPREQLSVPSFKGISYFLALNANPVELVKQMLLSWRKLEAYYAQKGEPCLTVFKTLRQGLGLEFVELTKATRIDAANYFVEAFNQRQMQTIFEGVYKDSPSVNAVSLHQFILQDMPEGVEKNRIEQLILMGIFAGCQKSLSHYGQQTNVLLHDFKQLIELLAAQNLNYIDIAEKLHAFLMKMEQSNSAGLLASHGPFVNLLNTIFKKICDNVPPATREGLLLILDKNRLSLVKKSEAPQTPLTTPSSGASQAPIVFHEGALFKDVDTLIQKAEKENETPIEAIEKLTAYIDFLSAKAKKDSPDPISRVEMSKAVRALHFRAKLFFGIGLQSHALNDFSLILSLNPKDYFALYQRGRIYYELGQWEEAKNDMLAIPETDTLVEQAGTYLSAIYFKENEEEISLKKMINHFLDSLNQPKISKQLRSTCHLLLAHCYIEANLIKEAQLHLNLHKKWHGGQADLFAVRIQNLIEEQELIDQQAIEERNKRMAELTQKLKNGMRDSPSLKKLFTNIDDFKNFAEELKFHPFFLRNLQIALKYLDTSHLESLDKCFREFLQTDLIAIICLAVKQEDASADVIILAQDILLRAVDVGLLGDQAASRVATKILGTLNPRTVTSSHKLFFSTVSFIQSVTFWELKTEKLNALIARIQPSLERLNLSIINQLLLQLDDDENEEIVAKRLNMALEALQPSQSVDIGKACSRFIQHAIQQNDAFLLRSAYELAYLFLEKVGCDENQSILIEQLGYALATITAEKCEEGQTSTFYVGLGMDLQVRLDAHIRKKSFHRGILERFIEKYAAIFTSKDSKQEDLQHYLQAYTSLAAGNEAKASFMLKLKLFENKLPLPDAELETECDKLFKSLMSNDSSKLLYAPTNSEDLAEFDRYWTSWIQNVAKLTVPENIIHLLSCLFSSGTLWRCPDVWNTLWANANDDFKVRIFLAIKDLAIKSIEVNKTPSFHVDLIDWMQREMVKKGCLKTNPGHYEGLFIYINKVCDLIPPKDVEKYAKELYVQFSAIIQPYLVKKGLEDSIFRFNLCDIFLKTKHPDWRKKIPQIVDAIPFVNPLVNKAGDYKILSIYKSLLEVYDHTHHVETVKAFLKWMETRVVHIYSVTTPIVLESQLVQNILEVLTLACKAAAKQPQLIEVLSALYDRGGRLLGSIWTSKTQSAILNEIMTVHLDALSSANPLDLPTISHFASLINFYFSYYVDQSELICTVLAKTFIFIHKNEQRSFATNLGALLDQAEKLAIFSTRQGSVNPNVLSVARAKLICEGVYIQQLARFNLKQAPAEFERLKKAGSLVDPSSEDDMQTLLRTAVALFDKIYLLHLIKPSNLFEQYLRWFKETILDRHINKKFSENVSSVIGKMLIRMMGYPISFKLVAVSAQSDVNALADSLTRVNLFSQGDLHAQKVMSSLENLNAVKKMEFKYFDAIPMLNSCYGSFITVIFKPNSVESASEVVPKQDSLKVPSFNEMQFVAILKSLLASVGTEFSAEQLKKLIEGLTRAATEAGLENLASEIEQLMTLASSATKGGTMTKTNLLKALKLAKRK